ncbi:hypothetical protein [Acaryochloris sp. IP29b_bin.137]|uniref:hypothetical protein n=1 Tax=Acaryochloris sp. IP29b_bin.137 TaxID=2969217 RepID=UPI00260CA059|nr:hypothetical protein [Acaryochloris sp. IP29b_bin.137]
MPISYSFANAQRLVIKPFDRLGFISLYTFVTVASIFATNFITEQPPFIQLWQQNPMQYSIISGLVSGTVMGAAQWLILRRYFPNWQWILAVAVGMTLSSTLQFAFNQRFNELLFGVVDHFPGTRTTSVAALTAIYMALLGATVIAGFLQWYILQAYVAPARWWILIPLFTALVGIAPLILVAIAQQHISLPFAILMNATYLYPAIQAIAFCCLHKKSEQNIRQSALATAPDIANFWKTQALAKKLYASLTQLWKTDLNSSIGQLSYLVGVNPNGFSIIFEPMDTTSANNVELTPLTTIASNLNEADLKLEGKTFAKFQLLFSPPGVIQIFSWRGIPLVWLSVGVYIATVAIQYFLAWFQLGRG